MGHSKINIDKQQLQQQQQQQQEGVKVESTKTMDPNPSQLNIANGFNLPFPKSLVYTTQRNHLQIYTYILNLYKFIIYIYKYIRM